MSGTTWSTITDSIACFLVCATGTTITNEGAGSLVVLWVLLPLCPTEKPSTLAVFCGLPHFLKLSLQLIIINQHSTIGATCTARTWFTSPHSFVQQDIAYTGTIHNGLFQYVKIHPPQKIKFWFIPGLRKHNWLQQSRTKKRTWSLQDSLKIYFYPSRTH